MQQAQAVNGLPSIVGDDTIRNAMNDLLSRLAENVPRTCTSHAARVIRVAGSDKLIISACSTAKCKCYD